nr:unnamed protein product [Callosobruchus chinensis]
MGIHLPPLWREGGERRAIQVPRPVSNSVKKPDITEYRLSRGAPTQTPMAHQTLLLGVESFTYTAPSIVTISQPYSEHDH